jgi:hypothetical protein
LSKKGNRNAENLAYASFVHPILKYGSAGWDPCTEGQRNALDRVQKKAGQLTNHTTDSDRETLAKRRTIARLCPLFKPYSGERAWKAIGDRIRRPYCMSRVDHVRKIRDRKQRTDIGKCSFVNWTIKSGTNWTIKSGTNYLQKREELSLVNIIFLERVLGKQ